MQKQENCEQLRKFAQIIPQEMLDALSLAAAAKGISLELEIASRLRAALTAPETFSLNFNSQQIRRRKFNLQEAVAECARKRLGNLYLYELEKLRLFLRFKHKLPRGLKEKFSLIDVAAASKEILAELAAEAALFEPNID